MPFFEEQCHDLVSIKSKEGLFILLNYSDSAEIDKQQELLLKSLEDQLKMAGMITIARSNETTDISSLSIQSAIRALRYRIAFGTGRIISPEQCNLKRCKILSSNILMELRQAFEIANKTILKTIFDEKLKKYFQDDTIDPYDLIEAWYAIFNLFNSSISSNLEINKSQYFKNYMLEIENVSSMSKIYDHMLPYILNICDKINGELANKESQYIRLCKEYIHDNYAKNITLKELAKLANMSPVYFSTQFKREENKNFTDYLIDYRINVSKQLLKGRNFSVSEVAKKVGYQDARYFSKLFRKRVGIKPSEYQKLYS